MIKNRFLKNTSWILFGRIFRLLISFFISIITARFLGPSNNGILNYVTSYITFFTALIGLGLNGVIVYEFVNHPKEEGKILGTAIALRFFTSILCSVAFLGIVFLTDGNDKTIMTVSILQAIQLPFLCLDTINFWFQAKMQSKYAVYAQTIAYLVMALYKIYLLVCGKSVVWFAFAVSLDYMVLGIVCFLLYQKKKNQPLGFSGDIAKRLFKSSLPFILADIMTVIYGQMDKIMIKWLLNDTVAVGLYAIAITICALISFVPIAILDSARPLIAEAKIENEEKYQLRFRQLAAGLIWISIFYSLFITLFSKEILYILYGADYIGANVCLKIAVWYTAFSYLGSARNFWLVCENKKRFVFIFSAIGAACNIIMNFAFIPIWGINGAAIATLATQILANFVIPFFFKETRAYGKHVFYAFLLRKIELKKFLKIFLSRIQK